MASTENDEYGAVQFSGYLTKQGGARGGFKTWRKRWFVLKRDCLYYYKSKPVSGDETTMLGVLPLQNAKVKQTTADSGADAWLEETVCFECKRMFNMMTSKKQCRRCQHAFCKSCASCKVSIPSAGYDKPVKVCNQCYLFIVKGPTSGTHENNVRRRIETMPCASLNIENNDGRICDSSKDTESHTQMRPMDRTSFFIMTPERQLRVRAESEQGRRQWINALEQVIQRNQRDRNPSVTSTSLSSAETWEIDYSALTILEKIGDGAFGDVFKGRLWGTDVAIKKVKKKELTPKILNDLKNEIAILNTLRHPNVVLYIGACTTPPHVCIVTEWCDRGSLYDVIYKQKIPIDTKRAVDIAIGVAQGMSYLHNLDRKIIHRDLKSHNILLDHNFNIKIADFGLSYMREEEMLADNTDIADKEDGGQFGVFGTPEWMAPEVMEGIPYDEKVDVYSFAVVLTELVSRQIPLRDKYTIKSYIDVFEAVLEDGARPTIPDWTSGDLRKLIVSCYDVDPKRRPSFIQIIARLAHAFHMSERNIFCTFDVPRLMGMLKSKRKDLVEIAAREIGMAKDASSACERCGHDNAPFRTLERETLLGFITYLVHRVGSKHLDVATYCCQALLALRSCIGGVSFRTKWSAAIINCNGLSSIITRLKSPEEKLRVVAKKVVLEMAPDILALQQEQLNDLSFTTKKLLEDVLDEEMIVLSRRLEQDRTEMAAKKELIDKLSSLRQRASIDQFETEVNDPVPIHQLVNVDTISAIANTFPAPGIRSIRQNGKLSDKFQLMINSQRGGKGLGDYGLIYHPESRQWSHVFFIVLNKEIRVYASAQSDPDQYLAIVTIPQPEKHSVTLGRKGSKPHCVHVEAGDDVFVVCTRSSDQARLWAHILAPEFHEHSNSISQTNVTKDISGTMSTSELVRMVKALPPQDALPEEVRKEIGDCHAHQFGWLLCLDEQINIWYPSFAVAYGSLYLRLFESPQNALNNEIMCIDLSPRAGIATFVVPSPKNSQDSWSKRIFGVDIGSSKFSFCASTPAEREFWVKMLRESIDEKKSREMQSVSNLRALPVDLKNVFQLDCGVSTNNLKKYKVHDQDIEKATGCSLQRSANVINSAIETSDDEANETEILTAPSGSSIAGVHPEFIEAFGQCSMHGYLLKRGGFRKNWKLRYFYLVKNEMRYFPSHTSHSSTVLGTVYTATASGKPFPVFSDDKNRKEFCFGIQNPGRTWLFAAHREDDLKEWMKAISESNLPKS